MPNPYLELRNEIARIARREVRREVDVLKKTVTAQRSQIAQQRKAIDEMQGVIKRLQKQTPNGAAASPRQEGEPGGGKRRFRVGGVAAMRRRLGLSAKEFGALVGVSALSIYKWEAGTTRPRDRQLEALAAVRGIGKREAAARLAELAGPTKKVKPQKKRGG